ncbi:CHAP domain-containing protein [Streptomyces gilvus]|uniref:CHAP domain-containing protein n=1 Tax=Streptomyces gilvus TaxID=2920937 RepID=UPI001F1058D3|nr:CHAP domain-containing protein [Streptomyces sp. CME 23]MCH5677890.1 CHAP domain-containing protein [Streptomyces sp. CME 23]
MFAHLISRLLRARRRVPALTAAAACTVSLLLVPAARADASPAPAHASQAHTRGAIGTPVPGRARHIGNDYPWETLGQFEHQDQGTDPWREFYGQCDSFVAWKAYENLHGAGAAPTPTVVPAPGWSPPDSAISSVNQDTWGNAGDWPVTAPAHGWRVDSTPVPGAIVIWANGHLGPVGHVGYVDDVYPDGSITVENYNLHVNGEYSRFHLPAGGGTETSFGATYHIPWPDGFAHIGDGAATGADGKPLPPEAPPASTEYHYAGAPGLQVAGPGSPSGRFSATGAWISQAGHGELGTMLWAPTFAGPKTSPPPAIATWNAVGLTPDACYRVDAFVPDNHSNNPNAGYTVSAGGHTSRAQVDENPVTNDWAPLGTYRTGGDGSLTVQLDNRGAVGLYIAADGMRFWQQGSC